jgi:hypothetical protein
MSATRIPASGNAGQWTLDTEQAAYHIIDEQLRWEYVDIGGICCHHESAAST